MKSARKTSTTRVEGELLDVEEASRLLGVHRNTLYRLIQNDNLPALRLTRGGRWRFPRQDLLDWIEARQARRVA
ncbi:MAG: helix-turn-helix domain-containing protein [Planctomycetia bacterium]|nr:helix-turn-helix domain-containing protein [Planctomycetia bacterium]